ncbi:PH domain-containing protein [Bacillus rubiinfantis]|uniref:PH domain-containing protein n=1 Tax=Bacillus rubiinfantis TaxID=1499680 RepID=UPI0005AB5578|nr:PH domain-containing protein [Bacillus rubiinfantis]
MIQQLKRYHPAFIAVELFSFIKGIFWFYLYLFILKAGSSAAWVTWGRYLLLLVSAGGIIMIFLKWYFHRYEMSETSIVMYEGVFVKTQRSVPFDRIHNQTSNTTFFHRWFGLTSLTLDTGTSGENASYEFPVITESERQRILSYLEQQRLPNDDSGLNERKANVDRRIHFQSTKKDIIRASFTSLSFFAIFPLLSALYFNLADFFEIEDTAKNALDYLVLHWWMLIVLLIVALLLSVVIGFIKTSIKYGNYVISDDQERIYIEKGIGQTINFSIPKHRVQAVMIEQTLLKRMLGLASVKLLSAGAFDGEDSEPSSLYPFLPKKQAYRILQAMLPNYQICEEMERLPIKVLWLKLLKPYYLTIAVIVGLLIFKREWLWVAAIIFAVSILSRILDYWFTSYIRNDNIVQIRKGGFTTETFVTTRERIQQVTIEHSWLQRKFNITTVKFSNKAKPYHESVLFGISQQEAAHFYNWFVKKQPS